MILLLWSSLTWAATLSLDEVLARVDARVPEVAMAEAARQASEADLAEARGGFDPYLSSYGSAYRGAYAREVVDVAVSGTTAVGPSWSAGWRRGVGVFPSYAEADLTPHEGEMYARVGVPLLDGLLEGAGRADVRVSAAQLATSEASFAGTIVDTRLKATALYWRWVAAGAKLEVAEEQLALAVQRQQMLTREVALGARPEIDRVENERVVLDRRAKEAQARADLDAAAFALSVAYRDDDGRPMAPGPDRLPTVWAPRPAPPDLDRDLVAALQRPELAALGARRAAAEATLARARNGLLPTVDVTAEVATPALGGDVEVVGGVSVGLSATGRAARAKRDHAEAKLFGVTESERAARDQLTAEISATHARWRASAEAEAFAAASAELAAEVAAATERRFELGAATLLDVVLREGALADARRAAIDAALELRLVEARRVALTAPYVPADTGAPVR
jgi:outer membrane protein TolC